MHVKEMNTKDEDLEAEEFVDQVKDLPKKEKKKYKMKKKKKDSSSSSSSSSDGEAYEEVEEDGGPYIEFDPEPKKYFA